MITNVERNDVNCRDANENENVTIAVESQFKQLR